MSGYPGNLRETDESYMFQKILYYHICKESGAIKLRAEEEKQVKIQVTIHSTMWWAKLNHLRLIIQRNDGNLG